MSNGKDAFKQRVKKKKSAHDWLMPPAELEEDTENRNQINSEIQNGSTNQNASVNASINNTVNTSESNNENKSQKDNGSTNQNGDDGLQSIIEILGDDEEEAETFDSKYEQTNIYIERAIKKEIEKLINDRKRKKKKLTKKDIYNNALRLYLKAKYQIDV